MSAAASLAYKVPVRYCKQFVMLQANAASLLELGLSARHWPKLVAWQALQLLSGVEARLSLASTNVHFVVANDINYRTICLETSLDGLDFKL